MASACQWDEGKKHADSNRQTQYVRMAAGLAALLPSGYKYSTKLTRIPPFICGITIKNALQPLSGKHWVSEIMLLVMIPVLSSVSLLYPYTAANDATGIYCQRILLATFIYSITVKNKLLCRHIVKDIQTQVLHTNFRYKKAALPREVQHAQISALLHFCARFGAIGLLHLRNFKRNLLF